MRIYLTGFMGSGKTTYGKALAEKMDYGFTDLDEEAEKKAGKNIPAIFETEGEPHFRKLESEALKATATLENHVIATGGGAACHENQMDWMRENGLTVYLKLFEGELERRLIPLKEERPLIKNLGTEELQNFIYNTLRQRSAYYHKAEIVIDPLQLQPEELAEILKSRS
jgi:shikimate kinase